MGEPTSPSIDGYDVTRLWQSGAATQEFIDYSAPVRHKESLIGQILGVYSLRVC